MSLVQLIVLALATWRIANLVYDDRQAGPFNSLHWFRHVIGLRRDEYQDRYAVATPRWKAQLAEMHLCIYCMSFWYGLAATIIWLVVPNDIVFFMALPFALSATIVIVQKVFGRQVG